MPTVYIYKDMRFFFNSREESRRHVHIQKPDGLAKFWLEPVISLANSYKLNDIELNEIESIVREKKNEFIEAWNKHFGI